MNKEYRKVKERWKSVLSMLLIVSLLVPFLGIAEEPKHAHAASEDLISSTVCPHGKGNPVTIAKLGCFSCGGSGVNWDDYALIHDNRYSGNNITYGSGENMLEKISPDGTTKTREYYRCYNCGDTGYDCKKYEELIRIEYQKWNGEDWVPDIEEGENGTVYPEDAASPGQTWVPRRWCSYCGPLIYESHGANACYTDATWAQYHLPNNSEITLDFTDMNGAAIADEEVRAVKKGDAFSYTAPGEIIHGGERYQLTGWTCEDAEGNQTSGTGEAAIDKVSSDTYYIQFTYQKAAIEIKVELSAWLGEDKFSVEGNYSVKTENGNFDKVRVGWAKLAPEDSDAAVSLYEAATDADSASGESIITDVTEGCDYFLVVEVTTETGVEIWESDSVTIQVHEVTGGTVLSLSSDYKTADVNYEMLVTNAEYSSVKLVQYKKKTGETAWSTSSDTLSETPGTFYSGASTWEVTPGYTYKAVLEVTVRGKKHSFYSEEAAVPTPKVSGTIWIELSSDKSEINGEVNTSVNYGEFSEVTVTWKERAQGGSAFNEIEKETLTTSSGISYYNSIHRSDLTPGSVYNATMTVYVNNAPYTYTSNQVSVPTPTPTPVPNCTPTLSPTAAPAPLPITHQVNLSVSPEGAGSVTGAGAYNVGSLVSLGATPNTGYIFSEWNPSIAIPIKNDSFTMPDQDIDIVAVFVTPTPTPTPLPTATPTPSPTPTPIPHVCSFEWDWTDVQHWQVCKCGKTTDKEAHTMTAGEPDADGLTEYTCEECGYTCLKHQHNWLQWCAEDIWDESYDPYEYHWKICAYDTCGRVMGKADHKPTEPEYIDNGFGWLEKRCKTCNWLIDSKPVTVNLTLHPNGGTFPDGSTDQITLENIAYNQKTDLWKLSSDYFPSKDGKNFSGYYVLGGNISCMYEANYDDFSCTGTSAFFQKQADGTYLSKLTKDYVVYAQYRNASYTVEYHGNGADGVMYPSYHDVGVSKALSRNGYYFTSHIAYELGDMAGSIDTTLSNTQVAARMTGWAATPDGEPQYEDQQIVLDLLRHGGTVNLYAIWDYGSIILPNAHTADGGHKLAGWKTEDGTVISVLDDLGNYKQVSFPVHGEHTLTAVWVPNTYTVTFDTTGGTGCAPIEVTYLKKYSDNNTGLPVTTKDGYTFSHWKNAVIGETVTNDTIVSMAADHTLTAVWKANQLSILLDYNFNYEGTAVSPQKNSALTALSPSVDLLKKYYGDYYGTLPSPAMDGYQFVGWYLEEDEYGRGCGHSDCLISSYSRVKINETHTLYARWVKDQYCVDLDANQDYTIWNPDNQ